MTVNPARISRLQEHGLTEYESRAYLALLELENSEASPVADLARVPRTKIYQALDGLESKRLLSVIPDRPKRYQVLPIEGYIATLEADFRARAQTIGDSKSELAEEFAPRGNVQMERAGSFLVLKGRANISSRLCEMITKAGDEFSVATSAMGAHRLAYQDDILEAALARGTRLRVVAPTTDENSEAMDTLNLGTELRHAVVDLGASTLCFLDNKEVMLIHHVPDDRHYFQGADVALWSDDPAIVGTLKTLFGLAWALAVPYAERLEAAANTDPAVSALVASLTEQAQNMVATATA